MKLTPKDKAMAGVIRIMKPEWLPKNPYQNCASNIHDDVIVDVNSIGSSAWQEGGKDHLQAILKWLEEPCTKHGKPWCYHTRHGRCPKCMQQFKAEIERL